MLQEILLCLAGHPSPLLRPPQTLATPPTEPHQDQQQQQHHHLPLLSPPERALLATVSHLSSLHIKIKTHAASISASHGSTICRAVASAITSQYLQRFRAEIVEVERSILAKDAGYVGGYGIVPLSAVMGEFAPWVRRLEWLWEVVRFMRPGLEVEVEVEGAGACHDGCTESAVMKFLREESNTGYSHLEEMALGLVRTAEMVWLRQLSMWVLCGKLPGSGSEDFFIQPQMIDQASTNLTLPEFTVQMELVPGFVTPSAASSILFIGQSLHQIRVRDQTLSASFAADPVIKLLPPHLAYLKGIELPISTSSFTNVIASIRLSISQNALSQLLPLLKVLEVLHVMQDFLLLGRGEFAIALISNADKRIRNWRHREDTLLPVRKAGQLGDLKISKGHLATVLN
jgi:Gamma tubulin complex component N-terminal